MTEPEMMPVGSYWEPVEYGEIQTGDYIRQITQGVWDENVPLERLHSTTTLYLRRSTPESE